MNHARPSVPSITENPLAGGSFLNWMRLCWASGGIPRRYWPRAAYVTLMTLVLAPLRLLQTLVFARRIRRTRIDEAPLFILGHYRSGTTYLQNLLTEDRQWGFVSTTQAVVPGAFLLGSPVRALLRLFLAEKRPMDDMEQSPTLPEEPEHAIANLSPRAFYHGLCFPKRLLELFRSYVLFDGLPPDELDAWKRTYWHVLRAATLAMGGRRLLLKNPPDMARLDVLLTMFPDAKFVHIYRNPYVMYPSIENFYSACLRDWQLQDLSEEELHESILAIYEQMMRRYESRKASIPPGNLVEVRFEDLEREPLGELRRIYRALDLPGFDGAEPAFRAHIEAQASYRKNRYRLTPETVDAIRDRWAEPLERWGYALPEDLRPDAMP